MLRRLTASFTAIAFFVVNHFMPSAFAKPASSDVLSPFYTTSSVREITVPESLGTIEDFFEGRGSETVILIQDAHAIPDAQRSISALIQHFQKVYGVRLVALEGASGALDTQIFKSFPDHAALQKVFAAYSKRGELAGGPAAAIFSELEGRYQGIENQDLYERGIDLYRRSIASNGPPRRSTARSRGCTRPARPRTRQPRS